MDTQTPPVTPLPNARHEACAQQIASGLNATRACINVYGVEDQRVASSAGHDLLQQTSVADGARRLQEQGAVRTTIDEVDHSSGLSTSRRYLLPTSQGNLASGG